MYNLEGEESAESSDKRNFKNPKEPGLYILQLNSSIKNIGYSRIRISEKRHCTGNGIFDSWPTFLTYFYFHFLYFYLRSICTACNPARACMRVWQNILLTSSAIACPSHVNRPRPTVGRGSVDEQQPASVDFAKWSACTEVWDHVPNVFRSDWQKGRRIGDGSEGVASTGNTTTPYGPTRSIVTTLLEQERKEMENGVAREKKREGKKGMRQIAKRSHHATSVPFLSSLARFSFLSPLLLHLSIPIGYLAAYAPTNDARWSFSDVSLSDAIKRTTLSSRWLRENGIHDAWRAYDR